MNEAKKMGVGQIHWSMVGALITFLLFPLFSVICPVRANGPPDSKGYDTQYLELTEQKARAERLFRKGVAAKDLKEKERLYLEVLKLWPSYAPAYNNLADVYEKQGRFKEAIKNYEMASYLAPEVAFPYFGLGDVYFKLGGFGRASKSYQKGLKIKPDDELAGRRLKLAQALSKKIVFDFDSCSLTPEAKKLLKEMARAMKAPELKGMIFEIAGHTDSIGTEGYNFRLSIRRAMAVKEFLVKECGISSKRLSAKGYGEDRPLASNDTGEGRRRNRRVEVRGRLKIGQNIIKNGVLLPRMLQGEKGR